MEPSSRPSGGPGPDPSAPDGRPLLLLCAAVFVVALGIRAWGLGDRSFWLDETETIADISEPDLAGLAN